ncbi:MAG: 3-isopropylmalate dehydrogenase [Acidobacteria bacterium]|nr:3-isopropylmalate dehydrogenase [Acidobacteriota bacterium]
MKIRLVTLAGDGIGPEVTRQAMRVLHAVATVTGLKVEVADHLVGAAAIRSEGVPLPAPTLAACLEADAVFLGAVGDPAYDQYPPTLRPEAGLLQLRTALGGFANLRPAVAFEPVLDVSPLRPERVRGADVLVVRELLGGLYYGEPRGREPDGGAAFNTLRYSVAEVERVARVAFEQAQTRRRLVTSVDKANVLEVSRLWRETVTRVGRDYPDVTLKHMYVDAFAMRLATAPTEFDVVVTDNLFGDILSDEAAVISGSLGLLPSATLGGRVALYEPVHGSAPDIAGKDIANPIGAIGCIALLLRHTAHMPREALAIDAATREVLGQGLRPADLARPGDPVASTSDIGQAVERAVTDALERHWSYHGV